MSIKAKIYNQQAEVVEEMELNPKIFDVPTNSALIHQALVAQMANMRQVLAHTKGRGEVRGGGRKPWRQKGTGRARHGSIRSPIWRGGGVTFGPTKDRNFKKDINKKMKRKALLMALSDKASNKKLVILDKLAIGEFKTKKFDNIILALEQNILFKQRLDSNQASRKIEKAGKIKIDNKTKAEKPAARKIKRSVLVINEAQDEKVMKSAKNLVGIKLINLENINLVDLLKYKNLILTKKVVEKLEEKYKEF